MADDGGLASLSMRKLGAAFGVEAMSLYHYVKNKDDLLAAVLEQLYLEIDLPTDVPADDWETAIRRGLHAFHEVLLAHPVAVDLFAGGQTPSAAALDVLVWAWGRFEAVGLDLADAYVAVNVAVAYVMGFAANERSNIEALRDAGGASGAGAFPFEVAPEVAERLARTQHLEPSELFAAGIDTVVAGLRARFDLP
ncbi:MAG: TetR/AcrR family transcriptional regulator [Acidimicrobiales bacterium]